MGGGWLYTPEFLHHVLTNLEIGVAVSYFNGVEVAIV